MRLHMLRNRKPASDTATTTGGGVTTVDTARLLKKEHVRGYVATFQKRVSRSIHGRENAAERRER